MKKLVFALSLISLPAMAAQKHEVVQGKVALYVMGIQCIVRAGVNGKLEDRLYTQLGAIGNPPRALGLDKLAKLQPKAFLANSCDLANLDQIVIESQNSFGFMHGTPVEVIKDTGASVINGHGNCVARYDEKVSLDLGAGVVISATSSEMQSMNDCTKP